MEKEISNFAEVSRNFFLKRRKRNGPISDAEGKTTANQKRAKEKNEPISGRGWNEPSNGVMLAISYPKAKIDKC